jgi:hypothetical protein
MATIDDLVKSLQVSDEERKQAGYKAMMLASLSLLGTPRGQEMQGLSRAGILGLQAQDQNVQQLLAQKQQALQARKGAYEVLNMEDAYNQAQKMRELQNQFATRFTGGGGAQPAPTAGAGYAPTTAAAFGADAGKLNAQAAQASGQGQTMSRRKQLEAMGDYWLPFDPKKAEAYYKMNPEIDKIQAMTDPATGNQIMVKVYKDGTEERGQFTPEGKIEWIDNGQFKLAKDARTGRDVQGVGPVKMQITPGQAATIAQSENHFQRQLAQTNTHQQQQLQKPQWDSASGQWMIPPSAQNPTGSAIAPEGFAPGAAKQKAQSAKALNLLKETQDDIKAATNSDLGAVWDRTQRVWGGSNKGAEAIAKLKVTEANLMSLQPRMEGPQSNLDVQLYREMAGQIADPAIPRAQKQAALNEIIRLHKKYAGVWADAPNTTSGTISTPQLSPTAQQLLERVRAGQGTGP